MWPNPHFPVDLVTSEEIFNGKFHFLCNVRMADKDAF